MPDYVIEKHMPGVGELGPAALTQTVRRSCSALHGVAPGIEWIRSYLTDDKVYCVYRAPSEQALRDQMERWDLPPVISICEVHGVIGPEAAEG